VPSELFLGEYTPVMSFALAKPVPENIFARLAFFSCVKKRYGL